MVCYWLYQSGLVSLPDNPNNVQCIVFSPDKATASGPSYFRHTEHLH
jgi:hypothetical protein